MSDTWIPDEARQGESDPARTVAEAPAGDAGPGDPARRRSRSEGEPGPASPATDEDGDIVGDDSRGDGTPTAGPDGVTAVRLGGRTQGRGRRLVRSQAKSPAIE